jgi:uncharacterized protein
MFRFLCCTLLLSLCLGNAAHAQNTQWTDINLAITDAVVLPAYDRFAATTAPLVTAADSFCAAPSAEGLATLQQGFRVAMAGWQGVQHIQFGPITYFNWNFRLQFWPDDNGTGAKQLDALLAAADGKLLSADAFGQQSVGVQGFPALERLLFADTSLKDIQSQPYRCQVVQAITHNVQAISTGVAERWHSEFRTTIANADERGFFESAQDATLDYLKAVVESVRRLQQQKLETVLGANQAAARNRRAESWRSDLSVPNLRVNVDALAALFNQGSPAMNTLLVPKDLDAIQTAFKKTQNDLAKAPDSLNAALQSAEGYAALVTVRDDLNNLFELLEAAVKNTDLYLGFNSLDGD